VRDGSGLFSATADANGVLYATWQDSRFSSGARDGIALSRSTDGGLTWSAPVRVNAQPAVAAFTPTVHVRSDGVIGVSYFDFRSNTASAATLPTDYWLATSTDGQTFTETHVTGPFDLDLAPSADGLFLGDYQALVSMGAEFRPFFVKSTAAGLANRTDVFMAFGPEP
jgi:Neuraminidase (sialidase)